MQRTNKKLSLYEQAKNEKKRREFSGFASLRKKYLEGKLTATQVIKKLLPFYEIQPKPEAFHNSRKPNKWLIGGFGSGKTYSFCAEAVFLGFMNAPLPGLLVIQTKSNAEATTETTLENLCKKNNLEYWAKRDDGGTYKMFWIRFGSQPEDVAMFYLASGSVPDNLASITVAFAGIDEPFLQSEDTQRQVIGRARHPEARLNEVIYAGTIEPLKMSWGFEIVDDSFKGDEENFKVVIPTYENKFATPVYIKRMKNSYSESFQKVYIDGLNVSLAGVGVYEDFSDRNIKPFDTFKFKPGLRKLGLGFDFNVGNMSAAEFYLDGVVRKQIGEYRINNSNTEELCKMIILQMKEKYKGICDVNKFRYSLLITMDASARSRKTSAKLGMTDAVEIRNQFVNAGFVVSIHVPLENPLVRDRTNFVNKLAKTGRLIVYDNCKIALLDRKHCKWKEGASGFSISQSNGRSHMSDAGDYYLYLTQMIIEAQEDEEQTAIETQQREERV